MASDRSTRDAADEPMASELLGREKNKNTTSSSPNREAVISRPGRTLSGRNMWLIS